MKVNNFSEFSRQNSKGIILNYTMLLYRIIKSSWVLIPLFFTTKKDNFNQSSYIILGKDFKPISINDFYNFDLIEKVNNTLKITPVLSKPTSIFELDFKGNILN